MKSACEADSVGCRGDFYSGIPDEAWSSAKEWSLLSGIPADALKFAISSVYGEPGPRHAPRSNANDYLWTTSGGRQQNDDSSAGRLTDNSAQKVTVSLAAHLIDWAKRAVA